MKNEECGMKITRSKISHFCLCELHVPLPPFQSPTPHIHTTWSKERSHDGPPHMAHRPHPYSWPDTDEYHAHF